MIEIIPSILVKTKEEFDERLKKIEPHVARVHLDIADGVFVPNMTIKGYEELRTLKSPVAFDVHLMVKNPEAQMFEWYKTQADRIIIHAETNHILRGIAEAAHLNAKKVGAAINPDTSLEMLENIIDSIDFVQFMTVEPGFYGSPYKKEVLSRIIMFRDRHPEIPVMVDGAVSPDNIFQLSVAGVSSFVVGSYIFKNDNIEEAINNLKKAAISG